MPQVFGSDELGLIAESSLWAEAASEKEIERATHPGVAAEASKRGLVPVRMGIDPIWQHTETGQIHSLPPAHSGDSVARTSINNATAKLKRLYPTKEEIARANRTPEEIEQAAAEAANATRTKKQQAVDAARRKKEQETLVQFKKYHGPFKSMDEIRQAFNKRSRGVKVDWPNDTVDAFASRLRDLHPSERLQVHKAVFPDRYTK
jgi:hypothetical protein